MEALLGSELYVRLAICALGIFGLIWAARRAFGIKLNSNLARRFFPVISVALGIGLMLIPASLPEGSDLGWFHRIILGVIAGTLASHGRTTIRRLFGKGLPEQSSPAEPES